MSHACTCASAGYCPRFLREMSQKDRDICRDAVFTPEVCESIREEWRKNAEERAQRSEPGLAGKAAHLGQATAKHVRDGGRRVEDAEYRRRLEVCRGCGYCEPRRMVCRHNHCGCRLQVKARWRTSACPLGLWEKETETTAAESAEN